MNKAQRYRQAFLAMHGRNERTLAREMVKSLRKDVKSLYLGTINDKNYSDVIKMLKLDNFEKALTNGYIKSGTQTGEMAQKDLAKQMKRQSPFFSEIWTNYVLTKIAPQLGTKIVTIKATLLDDIDKLIRNYIELNLDTTDIAGAITDFVDNPKFYKWQAMRIARTETSIAMNTATSVAGSESGVLLDKEWISAGDGEVRESHELMNGSRVEYNELFGNGLMYPGDPSGDAAEVINCRCTFLQIPKRDVAGNLIMTI